MRKVGKIYDFDERQLVGKDDNNCFGKIDCEIESFQLRKTLVCYLITRSTITNNEKIK